MIEPASHLALRQSITERMLADRTLLDQLRAEVRILILTCDVFNHATELPSRWSQQMGATRLQYDPFLIQYSASWIPATQRYCLEAITPSIVPIQASPVRRREYTITALGRLMAFLGIERASQLGRFMEVDAGGLSDYASWIHRVPGDGGWAILFSLIRDRTSYATDTLIVVDGLLQPGLCR